MFQQTIEKKIVKHRIIWTIKKELKIMENLRLAFTREYNDQIVVWKIGDDVVRNKYDKMQIDG